MSHKKRASFALKSMGAAGLAAATIVSGLSFGSAASAAPMNDVRPQAETAKIIFKDGSTYKWPLPGGQARKYGSESTLAAAKAGAYSSYGVAWNSNGSFFLTTDSLRGGCLSVSNDMLVGLNGVSCASFRFSNGKLTANNASIGPVVTRNYSNGGTYAGLGVGNGELQFVGDVGPITRTVALSAQVTSVNNTAKTAVVAGTATPNAKVSIGSQEVTANSATGAWSMTVSGLNVGANNLIVIQKIDNTEHDRKTVTATIANVSTTTGVYGLTATPESGSAFVPGQDGTVSWNASPTSGDRVGLPFKSGESISWEITLPTGMTATPAETTGTYWNHTTAVRVVGGKQVVTYTITRNTGTEANALFGALSLPVKTTTALTTGQKVAATFTPIAGFSSTTPSAEADVPVVNATDLTASVTRQNNIAKTAVIGGVATPGAKVSIGNQEVEANATTGAWSMTVTGLTNGANNLVAIQKINGTEYDRKTVSVTIVEGGTFVGVDQGPVTLERGESTPVPFVVENREARESTTGKVTLQAPEGTTFAAQSTVQGSYRAVGATAWSGSTSIPLTGGTVSNDGKTITFDADWAGKRPTDQQYRYMINVTANADAAAGTGSMDFDMPGTSSKGDFRAQGSTATTIEAGSSELAPITLSGPASVTPGRSNTFTGTGEPGATYRVLNVSGTQIVPGTLEVNAQGNWTFNRVVSNGASNFRFVIEQTKNGQVEKSELFTINATALAPVTVTTPERVTPGRSNTFTGTGEPGATYRVLNISGTQIVPGTLEVNAQGNWTFNRVVSNGASNFRFVIEQTKNGQVEKSELFTINAAGFAPVTVANRSVTPGVVNTFTGTGEPGATYRVLNITGTQIVPGSFEVDPQGNWTFDRAVSRGATEFRFALEQTKNGKTELSELFTLAADTK